MTQPTWFSLAIIAAVTLVDVMPIHVERHTMPDVVLAPSPTIALYHPDNERERAQVIAEIFNIDMEKR